MRAQYDVFLLLTSRVVENQSCYESQYGYSTREYERSINNIYYYFQYAYICIRARTRVVCILARSSSSTSYSRVVVVLYYQFLAWIGVCILSYMMQELVLATMRMDINTRIMYFRQILSRVCFGGCILARVESLDLQIDTRVEQLRQKLFLKVACTLARELDGLSTSA